MEREPQSCLRNLDATQKKCKDCALLEMLYRSSILLSA
jgi:hypothetical protein